jgi:hypothetical protein
MCPHSENVCYNCGKEGHIRRNYEATEHDLYGDYMQAIHEGREADMDRNNKSSKIGEKTNDENKTTNYVFSSESHSIMAPQSVILGASNLCKALSTCESDLSNSFWTWSNVVPDTEMLCTLTFSKRSFAQVRCSKDDTLWCHN